MTSVYVLAAKAFFILIHTSVKLVTRTASSMTAVPEYFNPHEREARDMSMSTKPLLLAYFNPHEREARDWSLTASFGAAGILIHTSVKLVTFNDALVIVCVVILIHTSVKLVTGKGQGVSQSLVILIHTSVKLVTTQG